MSKFIDKLNQISQTLPQPMGFRAAQSSPQKPKLLLIASLAQTNNVEGLADYVAGADAGLLSIHKLSSGAETIQRISRVAPDIPWGGWLRDIGQGAIKQMMKAGCDFVVFSASNTSMAIPQDDKVGKILQVEASLSDGLLRTINELPVDAVLLISEREEDYFLTWHHLMLFHHFTDLLAKPLLVSIPSKATAKELQILWEAGVKGVSVAVGPEYPKATLKKLRQTIDKLTFPSPRKRRKTEALLPHISGETKTVTETEEDEEEE